MPSQISYYARDYCCVINAMRANTTRCRMPAAANGVGSGQHCWLMQEMLRWWVQT